MTSTREEVLARETRVRAGNRASATRLITQAETALIADPVNPVDLELLVTNLGRKLGVLAPLDEEILELTADVTLTEEIDHADQYQENVQCVLAKLNWALHPVRAPTPRTDPTPRMDPIPVVPTTGTPTTVDPPVGGRAIMWRHKGDLQVVARDLMPKSKWIQLLSCYANIFHQLPSQINRVSNTESNSFQDASCTATIFHSSVPGQSWP